MNALEQVRALMPVGAVVECVENTYINGRHGDAPQIITKAGKSFCDCTKDGKPYRITLPTRVSDVLAVDETTCTYRLGRGEGRFIGHTVTYRRVA